MSDDDADLVAAIRARARRSRPTGTTDNATVPSTHHIPAVDDNTDTELAIAARRMRMNKVRRTTSSPLSAPPYTIAIFRDFKISKIRARQVKRNVETSLACASDFVLESN